MAEASVLICFEISAGSAEMTLRRLGHVASRQLAQYLKALALVWLSDIAVEAADSADEVGSHQSAP